MHRTAAWGCSRRVMSHYRNQFPPVIWSEMTLGGWWYNCDNCTSDSPPTLFPPGRLKPLNVPQDTDYCTHHLPQATAVDAAIRCIYMRFMCISVFAFLCDCRNFGWYMIKKIKSDWLCLQSSDVFYNDFITDRIIVHITCREGRQPGAAITW